jgi:hypothetical protein
MIVRGLKRSARNHNRSGSLLSDQFLFVRWTVIVLKAGSAGQAIAQVRQWVIRRGLGGPGSAIRR